ncbi:MAG: HAD family hydrolase, partial [Promethearchaeota archaeon]
IFDLDGTLLDLGNIGTHVDIVLVKTLEKLNIQIVPERNERNNLWHSFEKYKEILRDWGINDSNLFWNYYDKNDFKMRKKLLKKKQISLFNDVKTVLELIQNYKENKKLAICTNTADYIVEFFLNYFKINHYFNEIFSLGSKIDQQFAKPSSDGILNILKKFDYDPIEKKAIMIGDSIHDIAAAKKAKIASCLILRHIEKEKRSYKKWNVQPDHVIEHLHELINL